MHSYLEEKLSLTKDANYNFQNTTESVVNTPETYLHL